MISEPNFINVFNHNTLSYYVKIAANSSTDKVLVE
jgi:hypothetical protein